MKKQEQALRKGADIIVATPGRLLALLTDCATSLRKVEILVLDEADRMLDEHFADQMRALIELCPKQRQTMLFSATMATDKVAFRNKLLNECIRIKRGYSSLCCLFSLHYKQRQSNDMLYSDFGYSGSVASASSSPIHQRKRHNHTESSSGVYPHQKRTEMASRSDSRW